MDDSENLSVKLFKPPAFANETSTIIGSLMNNQNTTHNVLDGKSESAWYRILRRPQWAWFGINPIDIERTLSQIAISKNSRSFESKLDTVIGYRQGNWSYEWSQNAAKAEKLAKEYAQNKQDKEAAYQWLLASNFYSLAAYPYIKGDKLSAQAQLLAAKSFNAAVSHLPYKVKKVTTKVNGKTLEGFLYLSQTDTPSATVMVSVGFECLQTDLWFLFENYFLPASLAMLTLDMPSMGRSDPWFLSEDTSMLHQAMLHELKNVPWVDHLRVGALGIRFGGNAATRLAFLEPKKLKSCVSIGGILHSTLCDKEKLNKLTAMQLDVLASRMGRNMSLSSLTRLQALSLKNQGILKGRSTTVPLLTLGLTNDPLGSEYDNQLAARFSTKGKAKTLPSSPLHDAYHRLMTETIDWFTATL